MRDHSRLGILAVGIAVVIAIRSVGFAEADFTPEMPDFDQKYHNSRVSYIDNGHTITVHSREFQGGRAFSSGLRWRQTQHSRIRTRNHQR